MNFKCILLATACSGALAMPAHAQSAATDGGAGGLEEIVVTAQKREENLQNVPVAVTAISAEAIANQRLVELTDLVRAAPSLTITQGSTATNNSILLRGIGTFAFSTGVEPSVAVIIDDMPVVQQAQAFDNMADLQRIEVLSGPQGTLFGKNSSAGVINIVTRDPDSEFGGSVSLTGASDGDVRAEGVVSLPIADGAGLRVTGFYHDYKGNIRNLTTGGRLGSQENWGVRAKFKAELGSRVTFTLTGAYQDSKQSGTASTLRSILGTGTPRVLGSPALLLLPSLTGITTGVGNYRTRLDNPGVNSNTTKSISGRINYDMGFANLISITSIQDWKFELQNDVDQTDLNVLGALTGGAANGGIFQRGPFHSKNFTQEVRVVSSGSGPFKYVVGAFFANARNQRSFVRGPVVLVANWAGRNTSKSEAVFAQLDYTLPSKTTISGGIRYNHEKLTVGFDNLVAGATANQCAPNNPACRGAVSDGVVTWKGAISQEVAPQAMVYASVARGYKGGAYDLTTGFNPARINGALNGTGAGLLGVGPVRPETSTSYELGLKSRFMDNKIQLNVVGFYANYKDFQASSVVLVGTPPAAQFVLNNVGKLRTKGVEVELAAKPADWLRIDGGASYTDAIMNEFIGAQGYSGQTGALWNGTASVLQAPCTAAAAATAVNTRTTCTTQDRSGNRLPNSPKFKWNLGATAEFPLGGGDAKGNFSVNYRHQSSVNFDLLGNPLLVQKSYGIMNASLGAEFGQFKITAFVNNLFDKHYASSLGDNFGLFGGSAANDTHPISQFLPRDSERYFGLKGTINF